MTRRSTLRRTDKFVSALLRSASTVGIVAGIGALLPATSARADCQPDPASSGQTVICTGVDHDGFVAGAGVNNLDVRVRANATVHDNGVVAIELNNRNTVDNKGTIDTQRHLRHSRRQPQHHHQFQRDQSRRNRHRDLRRQSQHRQQQRRHHCRRGRDRYVRRQCQYVLERGTAGPSISALAAPASRCSAAGGDTVTNNGAITGAHSTVGIESLGSHSTIINNGTIMLGKANPSPSVGVIINDHTTLTNNNLIQVGVGGEGIEADGAHNRIINNGMITAGTNGVGILAGVVDGHNHIRNFGTISTHGIFADAIVMENGGTVFNAGTIANTTPGGVAIDFCFLQHRLQADDRANQRHHRPGHRDRPRHLPARRHRQRQFRSQQHRSDQAVRRFWRFQRRQRILDRLKSVRAKRCLERQRRHLGGHRHAWRTSTSTQAARCSPAPRRAPR